MSQFYPHIAARAQHRCEYCHAPEVVFNARFEVEHIIPLAHGGADHEANLALACRSCNLWKAAHVHGDDPVTGETVRLFHPREHNWADHLMVAAEGAEILGRTAIGRATVGRLRLNHAAQLAARRQWMRLGLFP
jgi:hypothetical protein